MKPVLKRIILIFLAAGVGRARIESVGMRLGYAIGYCRGISRCFWGLFLAVGIYVVLLLV